MVGPTFSNYLGGGEGGGENLTYGGACKSFVWGWLLGVIENTCSLKKYPKRWFSKDFKLIKL